MSLFKNIAKAVGKVALDVASESLQQVQKQNTRKAMQSNERYGGKTLIEWDCEWRYAGRLGSMSLTEYNRYVGLYRAKLNGRIVYIGRAIEWNNGGFRKRLSDYRRDSNSARKHGSGQKMYAHRDELDIELLIVGTDGEAAQLASKLEGLMVGKYNPEWNKIKSFS